nr:immunoglobulin epsilon heavy chain-like [Labrus bergylta]
MSGSTPTMLPVALLLLLAAGSCVKCEQLTQPASVTVQPGQRLTITCQVSYSVSSYWTAWIRQPAGKGLEWIIVGAVGYSTHTKDSLKNQFSIDLDSSRNTATLNGLNMQPADSAVYYCARGSGNYAFDYWGKGTMVTVTSATSSKPTVFPLMQCGSETANTVTLGCLATGFSPSSVTYAWSKAGTALTDFIQYPPVEKSGVYTGISQIKVNKEDLDAKQTFKCIASNTAGDGEGIFIVTLPIYKEPTLKVFSSCDGERRFPSHALPKILHQSSTSSWVMDLAFLVDITQQLNILNLKLQGPDQLITAAYESVKAFCTKLRLWKTQLSAKNLSHFPAFRSLVEQGTAFSGDEYTSAIDNLLQEFDQRFADFKEHRVTFQVFADPFSADVESVPSVLQMELVDLQCNSELKNKFREVQGRQT